MAKRYPPAVHEFIKANVKGTTTAELVTMTNAACGTCFTVTQMKSYKHNHKLKSETPCGVPPGTSIKFPAGILERLREIAPGRTRPEIAEILNSEFGAGTVTAKQVNGLMKNNKICSGRDGRFYAGQKSWNKGKHPPTVGRMAETQFRKGEHPHNYLPVGSIVHNSDGYLMRKIADPSTWEFVHRATWEAAHGKIKPGEAVTFKDGNKDNCSLDNLILVTNDENLELNRRKLRSKYGELTEIGVSIARLNVTARKKRKGQTHERH